MQYYNINYQRVFFSKFADANQPGIVLEFVTQFYFSSPEENNSVIECVIEFLTESQNKPYEHKFMIFTIFKIEITTYL